MSRMLGAAIIALAAAIFAPAGIADERREPSSVRITYSDLDMSTRAGGEILLSRIEEAARVVCKAGGPSAMWENQPHPCRRKAVKAAVAKANIRMLTLAWRGGDRTTRVFAWR